MRPEQKALLVRSGALRTTDLTDFMNQNAVREARAVASEAARVVLSQRDTKRWLDRLDNLPEPNARRLAAIRALPG